MAYGQGVPINQLAQRFGIHRVTVTAPLRRHGVELRGAGLAPEEIRAAAHLYCMGWSLTRLGAKFGVDPATVWRALRATGVATRSPTERRTLPKR
jgi:hypothetical protein